MNNQNLKSNTERTPSERKELARKAGVASGESRRERKVYAEIAKELGILEDINWKEKYPELYDILGKYGEVTQDVLVVAAQYRKAKEGDTRAATWIRDTKGESVQSIVDIQTTKTKLYFEDLMPQETYILRDSKH